MNHIAPHRALSKFVSWLTVFVLLQPYGLAANNPSAPNNTSAPAPTKDIGWPRQISKNGSQFVYYQPQIDEWRDYKELFGRAAFSLTPSGGEQTMGVVSFHANTIVDKEARTAYIRDIELLDARFPSLDREAVGQMTALLKSLMPTGGETISMDRLIADMEQSKTPAATHAIEVKNDPPQIFYSATPAILLLVDGEPVLAPVEKTDLKFVVNTNWDLFFDKDNKRYYLLANGAWLTTKDLKGQWEPTQKLPKDMSKLPAKENFEDVKKFVPPPPPRGTVPKVFFSSTPAELITFNGAPAYTKIPGTELLYATNTENDLFVHNGEKQYYVLLSGRWFRATELSGPWSYAGNNLPSDFSKIPRNSARARVLASVPGTIEAADAVMLAQIPTTAVINKKEAEAKAQVSYDGPPQFKPIEGTSLQYATNTPEKVVKVGDLYYLCFQGVWFMSKDPNGPWKTADSVPKEIYSIPPSSPVYNVTYVTQTNSTDDTVECSHTAGYVGMFVVGMAVGTTIAYGTGWYYPPYYGGYYGGYYGYYRPYPATYGVGARYNPYTGRYGVGRSAYGPYGGVGSAASYNPSTGRYTRSATAQGYGGGRTVANSYNPWTGGYGQTRQGSNAYAQWGRTAAVRGDDWARTGHVSTARGTTGAFETSSGERGVVRSGSHGTVARGTDNNVYAGRDGNVYRKDSGGNWSQYSNGDWNSVDNAQVQQKATQARDQASQARDQARQNLPQRDDGQSLSNSNLGSRTEGQSLGNSNLGSRSESRANVSSSTMQGLDSSAISRERGSSQTQRYSSGRSGGGMRSGGGFRSGGRRR